MEIYQITNSGKKWAGDIGKRNSDDVEILRALYEGPMDKKEISISTGISESKVSSKIKGLCRKNLAEKITRGFGE